MSRPRLTEEEMKAAVQKIKTEIANACSEISHEMGTDWYDMYNDPGAMEDLAGDMIFNAGTTLGERMVIAADLGFTSHKALEIACCKIIKRWANSTS